MVCAARDDEPSSNEEIDACIGFGSPRELVCCESLGIRVLVEELGLDGETEVSSLSEIVFRVISRPASRASILSIFFSLN